jgi:pilus assembly protein Flp/PilA
MPNEDLLLTISYSIWFWGTLQLTKLQYLGVNMAIGYGAKNNRRRSAIKLNAERGVPSMKTLFARFAKDESGTTAIEYGLLATLIGVAIIAGATFLGGKLNSMFNAVDGKINGPA